MEIGNYFKKWIKLLTQWCQKGKLIKFYLCSGWLATPYLSILGSGGCHDNKVIEVLQEMYCDIQKCFTMYYLTVSMATTKHPEAVQHVPYENSSQISFVYL